jgi:glycosyltransferase involved in cell wall biosynthesis
MKVALLTPHLSDAAGGFTQSVPKLAHTLGQVGEHEVRVIGVHDAADGDGWRAWPAKVEPCERVGPRAFGWAPSLAARLADFNPDIVDSQGLWMYPSLAALVWHRRSRRPYVVTPRGMLDRWALNRSVWKKRLALWGYQHAHLRNAACLRATSPMEAEHFRRFGLKNPIAVVANGIDIPVRLPRECAPDRRRRLLFLSRIHPKKGLDFLLRAWVRLQGRYDDWDLIITGPDEIGHTAAMQTLASRLGCARVTWQPPVFGEAKGALYRSADLFVLPTHAENFGLVVGEALAHEIPVITTRNAPWDGLVEHRCGWWIDLNDDDLVTALERAMGLSDDERAAMGGRGRAWVERAFSWPAIGRLMDAVYRWVLAGGSPPDCVHLN